MQAKTKERVGRGGLKLEAALDLFGLGAAVQGATAVDIGASTGGFTEVLLRGGAAHVLCVDAGHGQLHETLRSDPRVTNLEKTDWKRLSLGDPTAAGPFDFFTVDVSFVAARNMLRGLAFRLKAGAFGVVLVKPQFELPDHLVRAGDVSDPALRRQALTTFTRKAETLGFDVVSHADSPVAGGEGTIEILVSLRYKGRPESLPRPGEQRAPAARPPGGKKRRKSSNPLAGTLDWFAVVAPGTEEIAAREAARLLGEANVRAVPGGFELRGPVELAMEANLHLRLPTRLLLRLGNVRAREFGKLRHAVAHLPWAGFVAPSAPLRITVSATHCRLYHTGAVEETIRAAIGDSMDVVPAKPDAKTVDAPLALVRGVDDVWTISIDSSGERLHRRGWRTETGQAPLRETLAAALLAFADWQPSEALLDPMCGAGTIAIEACTIALGMAPGARRTFAFESWPALCAATADASGALANWQTLRADAQRQQHAVLPAPIAASDRDAMAVASTRNNAARAGVDAVIAVDARPLASVAAPADTGLLITNPPYGARLGNRADLPALYRELGRLLKTELPRWRAAVVVPDARLASAFRLPVASSHTFRHGGLRVTLLQFAPHAGGQVRSAPPAAVSP